MQKSCWIIRIYFSVCYLEYHFNCSQKISQKYCPYLKAPLILIHINTYIILHKPKIVNLFEWKGWGGRGWVTMHHFENIMQIGRSYQRFSATVEIILNQIRTRPRILLCDQASDGLRQSLYCKKQNRLHICKNETTLVFKSTFFVQKKKVYFRFMLE